VGKDGLIERQWAALVWLPEGPPSPKMDLTWQNALPVDTRVCEVARGKPPIRSTAKRSAEAPVCLPRWVRSSKLYSEDGLNVGPAREGIQMGLIPNFYEMKETAEEAIGLLRRAVAALEKFAAEQERANDLYAEVNNVSLAQVGNVTEL
jgi:hypothetical protein